MRTLPVRPLPLILASLALGNFATALIPSSRSARCVRRGIALGAVAIYAWMVV